jgi:exocyst complex component 3
MDRLAKFAKQYKDAVNEYSKSHVEDRGQSKYYTPYMIAITNNCTSFSDIAQKFSQQYRSMSNLSDAEADKVFESVLNTFERLRVDAIGYLLYELFQDVNVEIKKVGEKDWLDGKHCVIENVCLTLDDYFLDYKHLKERNFEFLKVSLQNKLAKGYITAVLLKKMTFKDYSQREQFARKFVREGEQLKAHMNKFPSYNTMASGKESPFDSLPLLAEFLKLKDMSMLFLEVSVSRCPLDVHTIKYSALRLHLH